MKRHLFPVQLALPLDYSASARGGLPQNPEPSKRPRSRLLQARLEANLAMLGRLDTVPGSLPEYGDVKEFRQGQRFALISPLLRAKARSLSLVQVARLSDEEAYQTFKLVR